MKVPCRCDDVQAPRLFQHLEVFRASSSPPSLMSPPARDFPPANPFSAAFAAPSSLTPHLSRVLWPRILICCRNNHLLIFSTLRVYFAAVGHNCLSTGPSHLFTSAIADRLVLSGTSNPVVLYGRTRPEQVISSIARLLYLLDPPRRLVPAL